MISVITPTYNRPQYLRQAVDSYLKQKGDTEMIVVNDGGEETNAHKMLADMASIKYYYKEHGGCPSAINYGIKQSKGEYICVLADDDMLVGYNSLLLRRETLKKGFQVVFTGFQKINGQGQVTSTHGAGGVDKARIMQVDYINIQSMMWKRSVHDKIGYFSEDLINNEDWEWKIKCLHECDVTSIEDVTVASRYHGQNKSIVDRETTKRCADMLIKRMKERYA